jgi:cytochrome subunit of sulfide dehydrogenase
MQSPTAARFRSASLVAALLFCAAAARAQSVPVPLAMHLLAATCANCHGTEGRPVPGEAMPRLAGQPQEALAASLRAFRDGSRPATVMHQLAKGYSNEEIDALAAYFAALR